MVAKYFAPLLLKGRGAFGAQSSDKSKQHNAILVNMSAKVGSISDNGKKKLAPAADGMGAAAEPA